MSAPAAGLQRSRAQSQRGWAAAAAALALALIAACSAAAQQPQPAPQRQAQRSWWERAAEQKIGHYWFKSDVPAEDSRRIARHMNIMYDEYARRLASLPVRAQEHLNVLLFADRQDYLITLRARYGVNASSTGGMFFVTGGGSGLAMWVGEHEGGPRLPWRRIEHVLQHEGFHQFAYSRFGDDLPVWANEGLAEFFGQSVLVGDRLVIGRSTPRVIDALKSAVERDEHVPFLQMLAMSSRQWSAAMQDGGAALRYDQAWSMVHFLVFADGGRYVAPFETYLRHINAGLPSQQAFVRAFGPDVNAFEQRWKQYALSMKPSAFLTALERLEFLAEGALELKKRGIAADSLESLESMRQALRSIDFRYSVKNHGPESALKAADDRAFEVPMDDECRQQPALVVTPANRGKMSRRERYLDESNATPPTIRVEQLMPYGAEVKWIRDKDNRGFTYQLLLREK